jgi:hypothetical protein
MLARVGERQKGLCELRSRKRVLGRSDHVATLRARSLAPPASKQHAAAAVASVRREPLRPVRTLADLSWGLRARGRRPLLAPGLRLPALRRGGAAQMSCAACKNARGYTTRCPYCSELPDRIDVAPPEFVSLDALNCAVCGKLGVTELEPLGLCRACSRWRTMRRRQVVAQEQAAGYPRTPLPALPLRCPGCEHDCDLECEL